MKLFNLDKNIRKITKTNPELIFHKESISFCNFLGNFIFTSS